MGIGHIGYYNGEYVIEAQGYKTGVVKSSIEEWHAVAWLDRISK
jgi:hypothetical protein